MTETLGRYEILEKIGQGGFAIVYRARDTELDRLVALKELKPILLQDTNWVKRFRREARAIARLDHPRIVPIYDVGQAEERLFIVMRLVDGPSLEELIGRQGRLPWPEALEIVTTLAEGLDHAHAQGILHRDLKPANILIDPDRGPLLTDFGLAKLAGESSMSVSATGSVVGSPPYIAPEVWEGQPASRQVDIYALGCILYELITGEKMFGGESAPAVMMAHFKPPVLPGRWPEGVPAGVEAVIKTALANKPADRYATAGEFAEALAALDQAETAQPMPSPVVAGPDPHHKQPQPSLAKPADQPDEPAEVEESPATTQSPAAAEKADWFSFGSEPQESDADNTWQGFLKHLGPYVIVIGFLAVINLLTSPDYLWFLWPAAGWGVGLAFHAQSVILSQATNLSDEWRDFAHHFGAYVIIIGLLIGIYLFTNPGGYPWFLWPAGGWGIAVALHLFNILFGESDHDPEKTARRAERRAEQRAKRAARAARKAEKRTAKPTARVQEGLAYSAMQPHLDKARAYKQQIDSLVKATADRNTQVRLQDLAGQVDEWTRAVEALARRVDNYQQNRLIHQDLETVPASIKTLETRLAQEKDAVTRAELERTLTSRKKQLAALQQLQNMMKRAELKIESTLSSLGTIYPQLLTSQSTNHVADYSRLSEEVDEEVRTLQDHLEALEEVKLGLGHN
jgi:serine/threonine protein kinase